MKAPHLVPEISFKQERTGENPGKFLLQNCLASVGAGLQFRLQWIKSLAEMEPSQALMAALLRCDWNGCHSLLNAHGPLLFDQLQLIISENSSAGLVLDKLINSEVPVSFAGPEAVSFQTWLGQQSSLEAANYMHMQSRFHELLAILSEFDKKIVWLKGTAISRTLYRRPNFRLSSDFDLLVTEEDCAAVVQTLLVAGFSPISHPAFCQQLGAGPVGSVDKLLLVPTEGFVACDFLALEKTGWPVVEIKVDPLEVGLRMIGRKRFDRSCSQAYSCPSGEKFSIPSIVDHLLIQSINLWKSGFTSWRILYDIHLLAAQLNTLEQWQELVSVSCSEGIEHLVWAALVVSENRLGTDFPDQYELPLRPRAYSRLLGLAANQRVMWNSNSLPAMLISCGLCPQGKRKMTTLLHACLPDAGFISAYYRQDQPLSAVTRIFCLILHWFVLLLPAGMVRRLFGGSIWREPLLAIDVALSRHRES